VFVISVSATLLCRQVLSLYQMGSDCIDGGLSSGPTVGPCITLGAQVCSDQLNSGKHKLTQLEWVPRFTALAGHRAAEVVIHSNQYKGINHHESMRGWHACAPGH
jgi:hypothetical protein